MDTDDLVTIYYDEFTDLFAIVALKENCLLDFGVATAVKYAEIFAYKSSETVKLQEICSKAGMSPEDSKSGELQVYQEPYIRSIDDALAILKTRYGSSFLAVEKKDPSSGSYNY